MNESVGSKEKILKTASRLFQLQGYHGTGLNQIIAESGAPKGSLYYHFPRGKEELAVEAVRHTAEKVASIIATELEKTADSTQAIADFILNLANRFDLEKTPQGVPIAAVALETSYSSDRLRTICQSAYASFQAVFAEKLLKSGYLKNEAEDISIVVNAMIEGAFLLAYTQGDTKPLRVVASKIPALLK
jgi:TetR/AcrR family transcriptional repressor of lmrAB and yxaGH operons